MCGRRLSLLDLMYGTSEPSGFIESCACSAWCSRVVISSHMYGESVPQRQQESSVRPLLVWMYQSSVDLLQSSVHGRLPGALYCVEVCKGCVFHCVAVCKDACLLCCTVQQQCGSVEVCKDACPADASPPVQRQRHPLAQVSTTKKGISCVNTKIPPPR